MTGVDYDAMIAGIMSASFITFWLRTIDNVPKAASAVLFSGLLSGVGSPVASVYIAAKYPSLGQATDPLTLLAAVLIGGSVTWGLPIVINLVQNKWGKTNV